MLGILKRSHTLSKIPLLPRNQTLTLLSQCSNFTVLSKLDVLLVQITSLWKHDDSFHTHSRNISMLITMIVSCWALPLTTGNSAKLLWFIQAIKRTADLHPVIAQFLLLTPFLKCTPVWSNNASPIPLTIFSILTNMVSEPNALYPPHFLSWDDLPRYSNASPLPCISSFWTGHKPSTPLATNTLLHTSADKQSTMPSFSLLIPLAIPPPIFSPKASDKDALSASLSSSLHFQHSPQISTHFSKKFSHTLPGPFHLHAHLLTLDMLSTQFSSLGLMILSAAFVIFSNIWQHELAFSSMDLNVNSHNPCISSSLPHSCCWFRVAVQLPLLCSLLFYYSCHFLSPHSPVPNFSVPSSLLPHLPLQTSTFVVLKPPPPLGHSIHSFDILSYLSGSSSGFTPKSSNPSSSTALNLKSAPQHKLQNW